MRNTMVAPDSPYFANLRTPLLSLATENPRRVLEIGCARGYSLVYFKKEKHSDFVAGVEYVSEVADMARSNSEIDEVICGDFETLQLSYPSGFFDLIIASHVLEHLKDPWAALKKLSRIMNPDGQLIGSLPNVRNIKVVLPLVALGQWEYREQGILDWTHTKFFTKSTIEQLLSSSGFCIERIVPEYGPKCDMINSATLGTMSDFLAFAYNFSARLCNATSSCGTGKNRRGSLRIRPTNV